MPDDTKPPADPPEPDPTTPDPDPDQGLDPAVKKVLDKERRDRREAQRVLRETQARLEELENLGKSETDRLRDEVTKLTQERDTHAAAALRAEVAMAKGLTAAQAKRLVGSTLEELEADADEILEAFPAGSQTPPPPSHQPKPNLRGGTEPDRPAADPAAQFGQILAGELNKS